MTENEKPGIALTRKMEDIAEVIKAILTPEELTLLIRYLKRYSDRKEPKV